MGAGLASFLLDASEAGLAAGLAGFATGFSSAAFAGFLGLDTGGGLESFSKPLEGASVFVAMVTLLTVAELFCVDNIFPFMLMAGSAMDNTFPARVGSLAATAKFLARRDDSPVSLFEAAS